MQALNAWSSTLIEKKNITEVAKGQITEFDLRKVGMLRNITTKEWPKEVAPHHSYRLETVKKKDNLKTCSTKIRKKCHYSKSAEWKGT